MSWADDRTCGWCGKDVPWSQGTVHAHLQCVSHDGDCYDQINALERDYSKSKRGRWVPIAKLKALLKKHRESESQ